MSISIDDYRDLFVEEAREHLAVLARGVETLASAEATDALPESTADALFRAAHSLKGMAATLGLDAIAQLAHEMEDALDRLRAGAAVDVAGLAAAVDTMEAAVAVVAAGGRQPETAARPEEATPAPAAPATLRVPAERVDRLLEHAVALQIHEERLFAILREVAGPRPPFALTQTLTRMQHAAREIHRDTLALRALPFTLATGQLSRRAREVAARQGKQVRLSVHGAETRVDRALLEAIRDPLQHLVTNAVAHGIETPPLRRAAGKDETGTVTVEITRAATVLQITVADDGAGVAVERVRQAAVARGFVDAEAAAGLDEAAVFDLLARPGFSMAEGVSEEAGRGVGLDAARAAAQQAGGSLRITSTSGGGTRVTLAFPPALELVEVIDCEIDDAAYAIAASAVVRVVPLAADAVAAGQAMVRGDDGAPQAVPVVDLAFALGLRPDALPYGAEEGETAPVIQLAARLRGARATLARSTRNGAARTIGVLVETRIGKIALAVDTVGAARVAAVKPLQVPGGPPVPLAGATVREDGRVAPILDPARLRAVGSG